MVVDACRRLTGLADLQEFQYVGFGGLEFNDFVDVHNALGIQKMTSIERDTMLMHRVEFNKPYEGIALHMGEARDVLPLVDWSHLAITWLDYTEPLTRNIVRDVEYVVRASLPGSVVIATVQCHGDSNIQARLKQLPVALEDLVPSGLTERDVQGWGVADIQREVLQSQANSVAREAHNGGFRQLFNFQYADDARMLTWGGVVVAPNVERSVDACRFEDLRFVRTGERPLLLKIPDFTDREWQHFERAVGGATDMPPLIAGIKRQEVREFAEIYRWRL